MTKMSELSYEPYSKKSLAVRGDRQKFGDIIKKLGGRWNPRMKGGAGWNIDISREPEIKKLVESMTLKDAASHKKSRTSQHKYHREISESEDESERSETTETEDSPAESAENSEDEASQQEASDDSEKDNSVDDSDNESYDSEFSDITAGSDVVAKEPKYTERSPINMEEVRKQAERVKRELEREEEELRRSEERRKSMYSNKGQNDKRRRDSDEQRREPNHRRREIEKERRRDSSRDHYSRHYSSSEDELEKTVDIYKRMGRRPCYSSPSSSSSESEYSDDEYFPRATTPRRYSSPEEYGSVMQKIGDLQRRMFDLDIKKSRGR